MRAPLLRGGGSTARGRAGTAVPAAAGTRRGRSPASWWVWCRTCGPVRRTRRRSSGLRWGGRVWTCGTLLSSPVRCGCAVAPSAPGGCPVGAAPAAAACADVLLSTVDRTDGAKPSLRGLFRPWSFSGSDPEPSPPAAGARPAVPCPRSPLPWTAGRPSARPSAAPPRFRRPRSGRPRSRSVRPRPRRPRAVPRRAARFPAVRSGAGRPGRCRRSGAAACAAAAGGKANPTVSATPVAFRSIASTSATCPGTPDCARVRTTESIAPAKTVLVTVPGSPRCSRPVASGSRTPSGASSSRSPPIPVSAARGPSDRSVRMVASGCNWAGVTQGTASGRSVSQPTRHRCAASRRSPTRRIREAAEVGPPWPRRCTSLKTPFRSAAVPARCPERVKALSHACSSDCRPCPYRPARPARILRLGHPGQPGCPGCPAPRSHLGAGRLGGPGVGAQRTNVPHS